LTALVVAMNVVVFAPSGTTTGFGTITFELFEAIATFMPPTGAILEMVTVPCKGLPPSMVEVGSVKPFNAGAVTVTVALCDEVPNVAVTVTATSLATAAVFALKEVSRLFAATRIVAGRITAGLLLARVTVTPFGGATETRLTVTLSTAPPATLADLSVTLPIVCPWAVMTAKSNAKITARR